MARVCDLIPGDRVRMPGLDAERARGGRRAGEVAWALFVSRGPHPLFHDLQLVVWQLPSGRWSLDALHAAQYIGETEPADITSRRAGLRAALLGTGAAVRGA